MSYEEKTWTPHTKLGRDVVSGVVKSLDDIFSQGLKIKEAGIIDRLVPGLRTEVMFVGGSPGKGGGIMRTPTKRTARMHRSGRRYKVSSVVVVGNEDGYVGIGKGVAQDHRTAIDKATQNAKLNVFPIKRGCGSWECGCSGNHSIPYQAIGRMGSVKVVLKPAPRGIGLCIASEAKKIAELAGVTDLWSKTYGNTQGRVNFTFAFVDAFKEMNKTKILNGKPVIKTSKRKQELQNIEEDVKKTDKPVKAKKVSK